MASIREYLDKIRLAIYGEEVRGSIINAIDAINNESTSANQAASQSAAASRDSANSAAETARLIEKYDRMTVSATELLPSQSPTVKLTEDDTKKHLSFGIPQGERGIKGDKGDTGAIGPVGPAGPQGERGIKGDKGDTGAIGPVGPQGERGAQGNPGPTPQITVKVKTGKPGTDASVAQTGTAEAPILTFTIPKGDTGAAEGLPLGNAPAKPLGSNASAGVSEEASRVDHIHPIPTAEDIRVVSYDAQMLTEEQKAQARTNIGVAEATFSGSYNDLTDKPTIPTKLGDLEDDRGMVCAINLHYPDDAGNVELLAEDLFAVTYAKNQNLSNNDMAQFRRNIQAVGLISEYDGVIDQPAAINAQTLAGMTLTQIKEMLEPVGTIFQWVPVNGNALDLSTPEKVAAYKGFGTWDQIKDRFLLSASNLHAPGSVGGEETHILTALEMPSHAHTTTITKTTVSSAQGDIWHGYLNDTYSGDGSASYTTSYAGDNQAHNNMPPYYAVYVWRRIA